MFQIHGTVLVNTVRLFSIISLPGGEQNIRPLASLGRGRRPRQSRCHDWPGDERELSFEVRINGVIQCSTLQVERNSDDEITLAAAENTAWSPTIELFSQFLDGARRIPPSWCSEGHRRSGRPAIASVQAHPLPSRPVRRSYFPQPTRPRTTKLEHLHRSDLLWLRTGTGTLIRLK